MKISVQFCQQPLLCITVCENETGRLYFDLTRKQNQLQSPYYRDAMLWTTDYMIQLAQQAKLAFGWDWLHDQYDLSTTTQLHKDLENSIGKLGFSDIPECYDSLLYDLHHCLHALQYGTTDVLRPGHFQIEWLTDNSMPLPNSFEFATSTNFGDLILVNPYVGHNILQIFNENDFASLSTTCRFHDIIKPGIVLYDRQTSICKDTILEKFKQQDPEFVKQHGEEKIKYYTGSAVIGSVDDLQVFRHLTKAPTALQLESIEFND